MKSPLTFFLVGFSASFLWVWPNSFRKWKNEWRREKLRVVNEVLEQAEERVMRHEERHDRLLSQICSHYIISQELETAISGARDSMNGAQEFAATLRTLQLEIIASFPAESDSGFGWLSSKLRRSRND